MAALMTWLRHLVATSFGSRANSWMQSHSTDSSETHNDSEFSKFVWILHKDEVDGLVQERRNSSALAMELRFFLH